MLIFLLSLCMPSVHAMQMGTERPLHSAEKKLMLHMLERYEQTKSNAVLNPFDAVKAVHRLAKRHALHDHLENVLDDKEVGDFLRLPKALVQNNPRFANGSWQLIAEDTKKFTDLYFLKHSNEEAYALIIDSPTEVLVAFSGL